MGVRLGGTLQACSPPHYLQHPTARKSIHCTYYLQHPTARGIEHPLHPLQEHPLPAAPGASAPPRRRCRRGARRRGAWRAAACPRARSGSAWRASSSRPRPWRPRWPAASPSCPPWSTSAVRAGWGAAARNQSAAQLHPHARDIVRAAPHRTSVTSSPPFLLAAT